MYSMYLQRIARNNIVPLHEIKNILLFVKYLQTNSQTKTKDNQ